MELPTSYNIFWRELRPALQQAGAGVDTYLSAIKRLKSIEGEDKGPGMGQSGYLNNVEPYQAVSDYISHVLHGTPAPFWLNSAERG